jgi:hypothetical protein
MYSYQASGSYMYLNLAFSAHEEIARLEQSLVTSQVPVVITPYLYLIRTSVGRS